jgi:hypothetical protein
MTQTMVDKGLIIRAVELACHAPSVHNSQPWRWVVDGTIDSLFTDRQKLVAGTDSSGREAIISCGALLHRSGTALDQIVLAGATQRQALFGMPPALMGTLVE